MSERDRRARQTEERGRVRKVREKQRIETNAEERERERQWSMRDSGA